MAKFFIDRPVFAIVLSVIITLLGLFSAFNLPIAQYPNIANPQISVSTNYVGAAATTVEESVAQSIEQKVNGVENMRDMRSTSNSVGGYNLDVTFNLGKNADIAAVEVQNRVSQAASSLPNEVNSNGIITTKKSAESIMYFVLYSPDKTHDGLFLKTYAMTNFIDAVKRVKGVSTVDAFGPEYAMRVEVEPDKMAQLGITASDIANAIKSQNIQAPVGSIGSRPTISEQEMKYSAAAQGRLKSIEEFGNIIVRSVDGKNLKLKDVANIKEGERQDEPVGQFNGGDSVVFPVYLTSDANALDTVNNIRAVLADAETRFPPGMKLVVAQDNTIFIRESMTKVAHTFVEALLLVLFVVYIFLGSWRATLIPMIAVPVSLIGTFAAFTALGFTINTLTMFAMILAIGLVVDDAIVVVEAVEHHIQENGLNPKEATYKAMEEVSGPVVAIAFVLAAVFVPTAFMGGSTGLLYKQFALTISVSMALSALVALTLTPALCALILKKEEKATNVAPKGILGKIIYRFNLWFDATLEKYTVRVGWCIRKTKLMLVGLVVMLIATGMVARVLPTGYVPEEDQSYFIASFNLPEGASSNRSIHQMEEITKTMKSWEGMRDVIAVSGFDILSGAPKASAGLMVGILEDFDKRTLPTSAYIGRMFGLGMQTPELNLMAFNPASLPGLSSTGSLSMYIMNLAGDSIQTMDGYAKQFLMKANQRPEIAMAYTTFNTDTPSYRFDVDREKAESLQVPVASVFTTLQTFLGSAQVNDFNNFGRAWKVVMQAQPEYRNDVNKLSAMFVRSNTGEMIPLSTLVKVQDEMSVASISRYNGASAFKIAGAPAPGYSTGQAMQALKEVAEEVLPTTYTYEWVDQSRDEMEAGSNALGIYAISILFVFLCLAALYESWTIPLAVLLSLPPAIFGCFSSQWLRGQQNDVYMQIAMIMLLGLAAKNAILIVEYAVANMHQGMGVVEAALEAAKVRLRPILMTSFAFILGCVPLAIATGAGAGSRVSMGNAVVGGMTIATGVGIFLIPVMFVVVIKLFDRFRKKTTEYID